MKTTIRVAMALIGMFTTFTTIAQTNNVGIGTTSPDSSAALEISATDKGMLVPRLTSTQRKDIETPAEGLLVFDVTTASFWFYNNDWTELISTASASPAVGRARNWMFGNAQGGGGGNVGLELSLPRIGSQGQIGRVNIAKFLTVPGESISKLQLVLYSNLDFNLGVTMYECTLDPQNINAPCPILYPRTGDGTINIFGNELLVGQIVPIAGTGSNSFANPPQVVTFTFIPPLTPAEDAIELFLENLSTIGSTSSIGIYQIVIE
jgi:hypothetical protein